MNRSSTCRITWEDLYSYSLESDPENGLYVDSFGRVCANLTEDSLTGRFESYVIRPGIRLIMMDAFVRRDIEISGDLDEPTVGFTLILEGAATIGPKIAHDGFGDIEIYSGMNMAATSEPEAWGFKLKGGMRHRVAEIHIKKDKIPQLLDGCDAQVAGPLHPILQSTDPSRVVVSKNLSPGLEYLAHQVLECPFHGAAWRLFMEGKALEILAHELEDFRGTPSGSRPLPNKDELESLQQARGILEREFESPPSLMELAHRVGSNDFKLKRGFRQVFGTTVFGYVRKLRMEKSRCLLEGTDLSVTEVAAATGYSSHGHFSAAFKKRFGILPREYRRKRSQLAPRWNDGKGA